MKKSTSTFLKHPTKDNVNRSANPPVTRASTIFNSMQELLQMKKLRRTKNSYYTTEDMEVTTLEPENILKN